MKKVIFYLLISFLLPFEAIAQVPTWPTEINKTIAKLQPKFGTTSTKFKRLAVEKSGIGGNPTNRLCDEACPDLQVLGKEAYQKKIFLTQQGYNKKIEVGLEVYITDSPEQAKTLLEGIRQLGAFYKTDCCP